MCPCTITYPRSAILIAWVTGSGLWVAAGVLALCAYGPLVAVIKRATKATKI